MTFIERYANELNQKYAARESHLKGMTANQINAITEGWLPADLNKSEKINYILRKEFPR